MVNTMHSGRSPYLWNFNIMDISICVICFKILSNPKIERSTRMHCIYQNLNKHLFSCKKSITANTPFWFNLIYRFEIVLKKSSYVIYFQDNPIWFNDCVSGDITPSLLAVVLNSPWQNHQKYPQCFILKFPPTKFPTDFLHPIKTFPRILFFHLMLNHIFF